MKVLEEAKKRMLKRKLAGEKGSVTLFVLIAMLFFLTIGVVIFITNMNNSSSQQRDVKKIQSQYNNVGDLDSIYDDQKDKQVGQTVIIVKDNESNIYQSGTWTNKVPLTVEAKWPNGTKQSDKKIYIDGLPSSITDDEISSIRINDDCKITISTVVNETEIKVKVWVDKTAPSVTFAPNGGNTYISPTTRKLLDPVEITATDSLSGVAKVEYIVSQSATEPAANDENWAEYTSAINEIANAQEGETYYIYAKVTDNVGNEAIIKSNEYAIVEARATFDVGTAVNAKMKTLAGNENATYETVDEKITSIVYNTQIPADKMTDAYKVSSADSKLPIYMWPTTDPEDETKVVMNWYSEDETPYLNADSALMFSDLQAVTQIAQLNKIDTSKSTTMEKLFKDCRALTSIDLSNFDTNQVTNMSYMFYDCVTLPTLDVSSLETQNVETMAYMFAMDSSLTTTIGINTMGLTQINGLTAFNTSNVTNMQAMFHLCRKITSLDLSSFDTGKVTNMSHMFSGTWTNIRYYMTLTEIKGLDTFNTQNVETMAGMFQYSGLTNMNLTNFDTRKVINMNAMFYYSIVKSLDISTFNTENVTNMSGMFRGTGLTTLDLRSFNTCNVNNFNYMFDYCSKLKTIYATDSFVVNEGTTTLNMFRGCSVLEGGSGTKFSEAGVMDGSYAHVDCGTANPGYFTNHYYIEFNANDGSETPATTTQGMPIGHATALKENTFTKQYYKFKEWNTKADGTGTAYADKASVRDLANLGETITLYAQWEKAVAMFDGGQNVSRVMKRLASGDNTKAYDAEDTIITSIARATEITDEIKNSENTRIVSIDSQTYGTNTPIYMWFEDQTPQTGEGEEEPAKQGVIKWYTEAEKPYMNTNGTYMFYNFKGLTSIVELNQIDTSNTNNMGHMFTNSNKIISLDVSNFETSKVTKMDGMFQGCSTLTSLNVESFDTSNVTLMNHMFFGCSGLTNIDVSGFNTSKATNFQKMFSGCSNIESLKIKRDVTEENAPSINMSEMFNGCTALKSLDLAEFKTINTTTMYGMFGACSSLENIDVSHFDTSKVTSFAYMFNGCKSLTSLKINRPATATTTSVSMESMFKGCSELTSLDVTGLNTQNVNYMMRMFNGCSKLQTLNVEGFDTKAVVNFQEMFSGCSSLTSLKINRPKDGARATMNSMFLGCSGLTELDVSGLNTENVYNMIYMFSNCSTLENLDVSHFDTTGVSSLTYMFRYCRKLKNLNVSGFNTSKISDLSLVFAYCNDLTTLDIRNFDTSSATTLYGMFFDCSSLKTIYASDLYVVNQGTNTYFMFTGCSKLVGGNGTKFSAFKTNGEYAWIDGKIDSNAETPGPRPGYFTNHYYIEFNKNDGTEPPVTAKQSIQIGVETELTEASTLFTREGFTYTGWNTESDGSGTAYTDKQKVTDIVALGESLTLYAQWRENNYLNSTTNTYYSTLTDALADIAGNADAQTIQVLNNRTEPEGKAPTVKANANVIIDLNGQTTTLSSTLTNNGTLEIKDTGEGGTLASDGDVVTNTGIITVNGAGVTSSNGIAINGGNVNIVDGMVKGKISTIVAGNVTVSGGTIISTNEHAIVTSGEMNITGGNIKSPSGLAPTSGKLYISGEPIITGTNYGIWYGNSQTPTIIISGGTITATNYEAIHGGGNSRGNITITGGNLSGKNGIYTVNSSLKISGGNITGKSGIGIQGNTGTVTIDGGTITGSTFGVTMANEGTLNFNGGKIAGKSTTTHDGDNVAFSVVEPDPENSVAGTTVNYKEGYGPVTKQNGEYYETTLEKIVTITADANGGTIATPAAEGWTNAEDKKTATKTAVVTTTYGTLPTVEERPGYTFNGWTGKNLFDQESKLMAISGATKTDDGYYRFLLYNMRINYELNGSVYSDFKEDTQYVLSYTSYSEGVGRFSAYFVYTDGTSSGYKETTIKSEPDRTTIISTKGKSVARLIFTYGQSGYYCMKDVQLEEATAATEYAPYQIVTKDTKVTTASDHTLYANWQANSYTVHFNANGGTGTMEDQSYVYGTAQALRENTFTRDDYSFMGWNTAADGSGERYTNGQSVSNLTEENNGEVTLYAQWTKFKLNESEIYLNKTTLTDMALIAPEGTEGAKVTYSGENLGELIFESQDTNVVTVTPNPENTQAVVQTAAGANTGDTTTIVIKNATTGDIVGELRVTIDSVSPIWTITVKSIT